MQRKVGGHDRGIRRTAILEASDAEPFVLEACKAEPCVFEASDVEHFVLEASGIEPCFGVLLFF